MNVDSTGNDELQALALAAADHLDHTAVDWETVHTSACLIRQQFRYDYTGPIRNLHQRLVIVPPERHGDQRLVTHRLEVSSPTTELRREIDRFGNLVVTIMVDHVASAIDFLAWIVVERERSGRPVTVPDDLAMSNVFREHSPLATPDGVLTEVARTLAAEWDDPASLAEAINQWVYREMTYVSGSTGVKTTAAEAFAQRSGVCQDYAHVMLAICRACGIPARYVSGHLLGEGGTHAWVEALLPEPDHLARLHARAFDPTHGREPGLSYVTVATGRDYGDVAPTSGSYVSTHGGQLTATKHAGLTAVTYLTD